MNDTVLADLAEESAVLDAMVAHLDGAGWRTATPAPGWTVAHQVAHLAWADELSLQAVTDPDGFVAAVTGERNPLAALEDAAAEGIRTSPAELLARWRGSRDGLAAALGAADPDTRLPWFGPPMKPRSMATARLMETWAHGQDVADALGVRRQPTPRLRHVAHIAVRALPFAFALHDLLAPQVPVRVELDGPDGGRWEWGPGDADDRVTGPALDFCLLATQRRHRDDLAVESVGDTAATWLRIVQSFAGPPGQGRAKGQFA